MKAITTKPVGAGLLASIGTALLVVSSGQAEPGTTAAIMLDRLQIEDLATDYYAKLGARVTKGREAINAMYAGIKSPDPGKPRPRCTSKVARLMSS